MELSRSGLGVTFDVSVLLKSWDDDVPIDSANRIDIDVPSLPTYTELSWVLPL